MPRTRSLAWAELKIGVVSVVAIALAAMLIFLLSGQGGFFWQRYSLKTVFDDVSGLNDGSPVRVAGVEAGAVTEIDFLGDRVEVTFEVSQRMRPRLTTASLARLGSVSLLGESAVDITPSTRGTPIPEWGYVPSARTTGSIAEVAATATAGVQEATNLLQDIRAGRGTVGKLFTDDMLWNEINTFVIAAQGVADNINRGRGTLGRLAQDPAAAKALEASLQNLEAVTSRIRSGQGSLGRLIADESLSRSVTSATNRLDTVSGNLEALTGRINRGEGTAGKLLNDPELFNRLNSMSDRLDKLVASLQQGEGTAGQLLRDRQLYENMNGAVGELRSLVQDIRKDPRKYLNVRVSLF
jgi:phospholipid/cholesterol/gamma-HCH transport system substrate-binding protein